MDTAFLSYLLTLCLILILILYLYQISETTNNTNNTNSKKNKINKKDEEHKRLLLMIYNENKLKIDAHNNNYKNSVHKQSCMPIHPVGPVHNFHQNFNKYINIPASSLPTGIPEMGWRNLYLANYSDSQVVKEDPFSGIPTRNFLDNLENVKNIYREEC